jgi:hypothetical protein
MAMGENRRSSLFAKKRLEPLLTDKEAVKPGI